MYLMERSTVEHREFRIFLQLFPSINRGHGEIWDLYIFNMTGFI